MFASRVARQAFRQTPRMMRPIPVRAIPRSFESASFPKLGGGSSTIASELLTNRLFVVL